MLSVDIQRIVRRWAVNALDYELVMVLQIPRETLHGEHRQHAPLYAEFYWAGGDSQAYKVSWEHMVRCAEGADDRHIEHTCKRVLDDLMSRPAPTYSPPQNGRSLYDTMMTDEAVQDILKQVFGLDSVLEPWITRRVKFGDD